MADENPYTADAVTKPNLPILPELPTAQRVAAYAVAVLTIPLAGLACGWAIDGFGELGSATVWLWGIVLGVFSRKLIRGHADRLLGYVLVGNCAIVAFIAETCYLHWSIEQGAESWMAAIRIWPLFIQEYSVTFAFLVIVTVFGAMSAYGAVARRYRSKWNKRFDGPISPAVTISARCRSAGRAFVHRPDLPGESLTYGIMTRIPFRKNHCACHGRNRRKPPHPNH
ncbi:MAG: hypothetical protein QGG36_13350 [Pirellulaceae bacterium]|nr:hypothetical protein [Pirellulaceae bacterium]MDP7016782.1 hypothetical protein [Pirellulaceae bacterium]